MTPKTIMVVAGDPSGDANAADLVRAIAQAVPNAQFIGWRPQDGRSRRPVVVQLDR